MSQDKFFRKELVQELRRIETLIKKESSMQKKVYYLSAAYGITSRTFRYRFTKDVLMADFVLQTTYRILSDRISRIKSGDVTVDINDDIFDKICENLKILADRLEREESIQEPLENMLAVAFVTTGPGNYLYEKGEIKI